MPTEHYSAVRAANLRPPAYQLSQIAVDRQIAARIYHRLERKRAFLTPNAFMDCFITEISSAIYAARKVRS